MTPKRDAFVRLYPVCRFNGAEAARRAGCSHRSARQEAHRLLTDDDVRKALVNELARYREQVEGQVADSPGAVMRDLEALKTAALDRSQLGPAVRATELQRKSFGMFIDEGTDELRRVADAALIVAIARGNPVVASTLAQHIGVTLDGQTSVAQPGAVALLEPVGADWSSMDEESP